MAYDATLGSHERCARARHELNAGHGGIIETGHGAEATLMISGQSVGLGPLRRDLLSIYQCWVNDLQVTRMLELPRGPVTDARDQGWLDAALGSAGPYFTIYTLHDLRPIGMTSLSDIRVEHASCQYGIVIGERDTWGHGYGTEVTRLMLAYAFAVLGMENVLLSVYANNTRGRRAYERAGFRQIGVRRNAIRVGRRRVDEVLMDATPTDLEPSFLDALMHTDDVAPCSPTRTLPE